MMRYDFRDAADFLNYEVPLCELRDDLTAALRMMTHKRLSKEKKDEVWHILLTCADFIERITTKTT